MGWCAELGPELEPRCCYSMVAHGHHCRCEHCGAICQGLFAACKEVWAAGPKPVIMRTARPASPGPAPQSGPAGVETEHPVSSEPTVPRQAGAASAPKVSLVTPVSPNIQSSGLPARQTPDSAIEGLSGPKLREFARELQRALDDAAAGVHARLADLEGRMSKLEANPQAAPMALEVRLSEMQGALATLSDQWSYLERVLAGLRADVASLLVLQRWAVNG